VSVIGPSNTVIATITGFSAPRGVAVSSTTGDIYVANSGNNTVAVINPGSTTVNTTIPWNPPGIDTRSAPYYLAAAPAGSPNAGYIYVEDLPVPAMTEPPNVSVINSAMNQFTASIFIGSQPNGPTEALAVSPTTGNVWVVGASSNTVSVVNGALTQIIATIAVGSQPNGVAVAPAGAANAGDVYVANLGSINTFGPYGSVSVISPSGSVIATINGLSRPVGVAAPQPAR
jgi:YVTN family beta-propeller protein